MPLRRSALSACPCGDPWGTPLQSEIRCSWAPVRPRRGQTLRSPRPKVTSVLTSNLPTNIIPTNIAWLKLSGKSPMGLGISPLKFEIVLESNPLNATMLVGRLGVPERTQGRLPHRAGYSSKACAVGGGCSGWG